MSAAAVLRGAIAAAASLSDAAVARAGDVMAARLKVAVPDLVVSTEPGAVRLQGRRLIVRAFGSRRRAADASLRALTGGDER